MHFYGMVKRTRDPLLSMNMKKGALKMQHIQSLYKALEMSWLHKLLDPFNHSPWKVLLLGSIQKWGGSNI